MVLKKSCFSRRGDPEPLRGTCLGEWDNQLENGEDHIVGFVSLGPKTYAYKTDTGRVEMKIKSITQNGHTENLLQRMDDGTLQKTDTSLRKETLHGLLDNPESTVKVIYPHQLKRNKKTQVDLLIICNY